MMMKKIYAILTMAMMAMTASAATADWFLYIWSDNSNSGGDAGQFSTTDTEGVFLLEGCSITEEGVKFCVRNSAWSKMYGWSDEEGGGSVETAGVAVKLAAGTGANGWIALPVGNYDVTWNVNDKTITFTESSTTGAAADWFIYYWDDAATAGGDLGQFRTTDTDGVFRLENLVLSNESGVKFCIHNAAWSSTYGWGWTEGSEGGSVTDAGVDVQLEASSSASAWLGLPVGKYHVTWDANTLTIRFDSTTTTLIQTVDDPRILGGSSVVYNLAGQRVNARQKGLVVMGGKKYINRKQ